VGFEQFIDETGSFELAELCHAFAKALAGQVVHFVSVELVFIDKFHDELALLV
jgi:hypothetical protein